MQVSAQKKRQFWLGMGISALCLGGMFWLIRPSDIAQALRQTNPRYLLWTALFLTIYLLLRALRWRFLLSNRISLGELFHIQNIGQMLTQLLPFRLGDVARAVLVGQQPGLSVPQGVTTMVVERLLDMLLMVLLLPLAMLQVTTLPIWLRQGAIISGCVVVLAILFGVVLANKRPFTHKIVTIVCQRFPRLPAPTWQQRTDSLLDGLQTFTHWRSGLTLLGLTLLAWLPVVLAYTTALQAVQQDPSLLNATFIMIVGAFAVAAPSSPGQIGVFHMGVIAAMTLLGMSAETAASLAILYHAINFSVMVLFGVVGVFRANMPLHRLTKSLGIKLSTPVWELPGSASS